MEHDAATCLEPTLRAERDKALRDLDVKDHEYAEEKAAREQAEKERDEARKDELGWIHAATNAAERTKAAEKALAEAKDATSIALGSLKAQLSEAKAAIREVLALAKPFGAGAGILSAPEWSILKARLRAIVGDPQEKEPEK